MKTLMAMGGALNPHKPVVLKEFVRRAGGEQAVIAILPQASAMDDTGRYYESLFLDLGAKRAEAIEFRQRREADSPERLAVLEKASGIFIAGGNQMRLTSLISGTKFAAGLHQAYARGAVLGGTSAGAAVLSKIMFAYGKSGPTPREAIAQFLAGFGFTEKIIFDQHFRQRDRFGRLAYAVAAAPNLFGVGIDEDTAAILLDDDELTVTGSGSVTILDGTQLSATDVAEIEKKAPIAVSGLHLHILTDGCSFRFSTRQANIPPKVLLSE